MKTLILRTALACCLFALTASAQTPSIPDGGVVNGASYRPVGLPGSGIAQGALFAVFGTDLGPAGLVAATALPLTTELGGTSISVTVNGTTKAAFLIFAASGQLAAVMPSDIPAGTGTLTVTFNGATSAPTAIVVAPNAFGIFTRNQAGFGPGIVQNYVTALDQPVNSILDSAHPGQVVILWGSGLGAITGDDASAPPVGNLPVTVEVWVGGKLASVLYAGRSPQFPAIDQINFVIPDGVIGCYVPVVIVVNGVTSNYVTIAVTESGMYCSDFQSFLPGELESAVGEGVGRFAFAEMLRYRGTLNVSGGPMAVSVDDFEAEFWGVLSADLPMLESPREFGSSMGSCRVLVGRTESGHHDPTPKSMIVAPGSELSVTSPAGEMSVGLEGISRYEGSLGGGFGGDALPDFFVTGTHTLRGPSEGDGSGEIGDSETSVVLAEGFEWMNAASFSTVSRDQGLTVQWTGADPGTEFVAIQVQSINNDTGVGGVVYCVAPAGAGTFTVPQRALSIIPPSSPWDGESDPTGTLTVAAESKNSVGKIQADGLSGGRYYLSNRKIRTVDVE